MGQIALHSETLQTVEAFSVSDEEWAQIQAAPKGLYVMPQSYWPAAPKRSIRGLRFFAHHSGFEGIKPKPESYAHTRLKIDVAEAARQLGYKADVEATGESPFGSQWRADVLVTDGIGLKTAFEVQLSSQTLEEFRARTERYSASKIDCCWILPRYRPNLGKLHAFEKAIKNENLDYKKETGLYQIDDPSLFTLRVPLESKDLYPEIRPTVCLHRSTPVEHLQMDAAIDRVIKRKFTWERPYWQWT